MTKPIPAAVDDPIRRLFEAYRDSPGVLKADVTEPVVELVTAVKQGTTVAVPAIEYVYQVRVVFVDDSGARN